MSVIAIRGVPQKWNLMSVVKILAKPINGHFEALNFQPGGKIKGVQMKICYLQLSEKLDPVRVVENINSTLFPKHFHPFAFVPDVVPDIPLASKKKKMLPQKMRRALRLADDSAPEKLQEVQKTPRMQPWWDPELELERKNVRRALNRAMNTSSDADWDNYREAKSSYKKCIRIKSNMAWKKFCGYIKSDEQENPILTLVNDEILAEMQSRCPGLYSVSKKTGHKLMEEVAKKVFSRLKVISENNKEAMETCFKLSQWYRRVHPHFGDFQLVLSTLHTLEDAAGSARTQLSEKELSALPPHPYVIDNLPYDKVQKACGKYSERIIKKVSEHINNLKSEVTETDTEDEIVRKKVREELKKMTPFLPMIVKQVVTDHFMPKKSPHYRVRIYGEPFLPNKETMSPFVRRYQAVALLRSERMYNLLRFNVPATHYASLMAMDGTVLNGAKLVIRSSDMPQIKVSPAALEGSGVTEVHPEEDQLEDWN